MHEDVLMYKNVLMHEDVLMNDGALMHEVVPENPHKHYNGCMRTSLRVRLSESIVC